MSLLSLVDYVTRVFRGCCAGAAHVTCFFVIICTHHRTLRSSTRPKCSFGCSVRTAVKSSRKPLGRVEMVAACHVHVTDMAGNRKEEESDSMLRKNVSDLLPIGEKAIRMVQRS
jgi:hypothetical protein